MDILATTENTFFRCFLARAKTRLTISLSISSSMTMESAWEKTERGMKYRITIPANTTAEVILPGGESKTLTAGQHEVVI